MLKKTILINTNIFGPYCPAVENVKHGAGRVTVWTTYES